VSFLSLTTTRARGLFSERRKEREPSSEKPKLQTLLRCRDKRTTIDQKPGDCFCSLARSLVVVYVVVKVALFFRSRQGLKEYTKTEEEEGRKEKEWRPLRSVVSQQPPGNNLMRGRFRRAGEEPRARVLVRGALEERR
jgi:hypothetical protein